MLLFWHDISASLLSKHNFTMKRTFFSFIFLALVSAAVAQSLPLTVQLDSKNQPYLNHAIGAKENFYSIGRIYNLSPKVFAPYNGLELTSALSIGQTLRIPLNETNFWQTGTRKENETVIPVYHTVQASANLTSISKLFGTDNASIRSWNNLSSDAIAVGKKIIIGFLKVDKTLSPLAAQGMNVRSEPVLVKKEEVKKQEPVVVKQEPKVETPKLETPKVETPKVEPPKPDVKKEQPKTEPVVISYDGNGYFKDEYNRQSNNGKNIAGANGNGTTFKSTSGWSDGKYYVLIDNIEKGTIILVKNPANGKAVYAKVLAGVKETTPGSTAMFLLSNAAASQLGISAEKFNAELVWGK